MIDTINGDAEISFINFPNLFLVLVVETEHLNRKMCW